MNLKISLRIIVAIVSLDGSFNYTISQQNPEATPDSIQIPLSNNFTSYSIPDSVLNLFPFQTMDYLNRFYPGVVSYFQNFYIRGSESYETGYFINGIKFNDLFTGNNAFFLNPRTFNSIEFYNGFIPADLSNTSSGLFNYELIKGNDQIHLNAEYQTDNITFSNDPYSGEKTLGAYNYGYNETNINLSGPLFSNNINFFVNANYQFLRDKNPQSYPGIDNLTFQ